MATQTREYCFGPRTLSVTHALRDCDEVGMLFDDDIEDDGAAAFDNTGVYYAWPASVVLCDYIQANSEMLQGKVVLELGAGLGLPGMLSADYAKKVIITDGCLAAIDLLNANCTRNLSTAARATTSTSVLPWEDAEATDALLNSLTELDVILCADVVYPMKDPAPLFSLIGKIVAKFPAVRLLFSYTARERGTATIFHNETAQIGESTLVWTGKRAEPFEEEEAGEGGSAKLLSVSVYSVVPSSSASGAN